MATKVSIIEIALNLLGERIINDIVTSHPWGPAASKQFDSLYDKYQSNYAWNFATTVLNQSPLEDAPDWTIWAYQYQMPSDALVIYTIWPKCDYKIYEKKIYCNLNDIWIIYRKSEQVTDVPTFFSTVLEEALASRLAMPVTKDSELVKFYDAKATSSLVLARHIDSQQTPTVPIQNSALIDVRYRRDTSLWYWR